MSSNILDTFTLPIAHYIECKLGDRTIRVPQIFTGVSQHGFSQWSQDMVCKQLFFGDHRGGIFIDVGAAIGTHGSNSYYYEKELGWTGICIEPIPKDYKITREARSCLCFNACAYDKFEIVDFTITTGFNVLSGISKEYDPRHIQRIEYERSEHNKAHSVDCQNVVIKVLAAPLQWFIDSAGYKIVDFLSIDVEGGEAAVMRGIDFEKTHINIIVFEDNYPDVSAPILEYLDTKGFDAIMRLGGDYVMKNRQLKFSWNQPESILMSTYTS